MFEYLCAALFSVISDHVTFELSVDIANTSDESTQLDPVKLIEPTVRFVIVVSFKFELPVTDSVLHFVSPNVAMQSKDSIAVFKTRVPSIVAPPELCNVLLFTVANVDVPLDARWTVTNLLDAFNCSQFICAVHSRLAQNKYLTVYLNLG